MKALKGFGTKIAAATIATGLIAGAAFAADWSTVTVNLPQAVNVGGTILASGEYKITESNMTDGSNLFIFRSDKGAVASAVAMRNADPVADQKTEVVLTRDGEFLHLDKLFIEGDSTGYQFSDVK